MNLETVLPGIGSQTAKHGRLVLHVVGDTGGVKHPEPQQAVADAMVDDLKSPEANRPVFFYHLGDVVYFNGEHDQYYEQFYEPYAKYAPPIFSIPGNHDGAPPDESTASLDGWTKYFMTEKPHVDRESEDSPRVTLSQPNVYFTLECPFATIVGMYTNVPEHGTIDSIQQQWLTNELNTAPQDKALLVCLHHPIYSFDDHHSGSTRMADVLQHAINDSRRVPNMVLTAHVHNYQRIEREIVTPEPTPFLVAGNGGYWHLHGINVDDGTVDSDTGARLIVGDHKRHGYVTLAIDGEKISGTATAIAKDLETVDRKADHFKYPAHAIFLPAGVVVSL